jgi:hypothetical protein
MGSIDQETIVIREYWSVPSRAEDIAAIPVKARRVI